MKPFYPWPREKFDRAYIVEVKKMADTVLSGWDKAQEYSESDNEITKVKKAYIQRQSGAEVAAWAFENIQGFATSKTAAQKRVAEILNTQTAEDPDIEYTSNMFREKAGTQANRRYN